MNDNFFLSNNEEKTINCFKYTLNYCILYSNLIKKNFCF